MMLIRYWPALVGLMLVFLTLPGTVELGLLTIAGVLPASAKRKSRRHEAAPVRKLAIVIPAHNEAGSITRCIASAGACNVPQPTQTAIVVVADNCSDQTAELARAAGARVIERVDAERRGKGFALPVRIREAGG